MDVAMAALQQQRSYGRLCARANHHCRRTVGVMVGDAVSLHEHRASCEEPSLGMDLDPGCRYVFLYSFLFFCVFFPFPPLFLFLLNGLQEYNKYV